MAQRVKAGRRAASIRRRKTAAAKHRAAPKAQAGAQPSKTDLQKQLDLRTRELREALDQQAAAAEVLRVISRSNFDLQSVLDRLTETAVRLCEADMGAINRQIGGAYCAVASYGLPSALWAMMAERPLEPGRGSVAGRTILERAVVQIPDVFSDSEYRMQEPARIGGLRTMLGVPLLREGQPIGTITLMRRQMRPFTAQQIALVTTFADQAVIAIENVRLFEAEQQRTRELAEALEQQTATSEVLEVISSSPGELQPVFQAMLDNAVRICDAKFGSMFRYDGNEFYPVAKLNLPPALDEFLAQRGRRNPNRGTILYQMWQSKQPVHVLDEADSPLTSPPATLAGARTHLAVPMLKDDQLVGAITIYRQEVRPFTDKQIALVENFAAQAVIAIENARLLNELRQRTDDLSEALEQQTATAEVLKVISSSPGALEPVFQSILNNATRICDAKFANLLLYDGKAFRVACLHGAPAAWAELRRRETTVRPGSKDDPLSRVPATKQLQHITDMRAEKAYIERDPPIVAMVELAGARTVLLVPMLKEDELIGVVGIYRQEVRPFSDKQIEVVQNFAAQAVIAIENTRLLNELRESLQQQTATADVLKVISRSAFDLQSVLNTLVESASRLCRASSAGIRLVRDGVFHHVASVGMPSDYVEHMKAHPAPVDRSSVVGRAAMEKRPVQIADVKADPEVTVAQSPAVPTRTVLGVPMLRDGNLIGVLVLTRMDVDPFTEKQIELVTTFADQAVIAIENVRLFDEIQDKSRQLAEASQHKSQFLANMSHELRTPLNAILGYTELITDGIYGAPPEKMRTVLQRIESNGRHLLGLINAVLDLSKIEAGQLVLDIGDYSLNDVVQTVFSAVESLAVEKSLTLRVEAGSELPQGRGDERRLTQVLLNLVGNAIKFTDQGEVVISTAAKDGSFDVAVRDTGPGISAADQAKLFQQFQQADNSITRKKGGTGLGLAISKRIVEMHGGRIWLDSTVGQGSTFSISLPIRVAQRAKSDA